MHFFATLNPQCATAREWRSRLLPRAVLAGVTFFRKGIDYVTEALDADEVTSLRRFDFVTFELITEADSLSPAQAVPNPAAGSGGDIPAPAALTSTHQHGVEKDPAWIPDDVLFAPLPGKPKG